MKPCCQAGQGLKRPLWALLGVSLLLSGAAGCRRSVPAPERAAREFLALALAQGQAPTGERGEKLYERLDREGRARLDALAEAVAPHIPPAQRPSAGALLVSWGAMFAAAVDQVRVVDGGEDDGDGARCTVEVSYGRQRVPLNLVHESGSWRVQLAP